MLQPLLQPVLQPQAGASAAQLGQAGAAQLGASAAAQLVSAGAAQQDCSPHDGAQQAGAQQLILTHFSARYQNLRDFETEARSVFPNSHVASDMMVFPFPKVSVKPEG